MRKNNSCDGEFTDTKCGGSVDTRQKVSASNAKSDSFGLKRSRSRVCSKLIVPVTAVAILIAGYQYSQAAIFKSSVAVSPAKYVGLQAVSYIKDIVGGALSSFIQGQITDALKSFLNNDHGGKEVVFAKVRDDVYRTASEFKMESWEENDRIGELSLTEKDGEFYENAAYSYVKTSHDGTRYVNHHGIGDFIIAQGDERFVPKQYLDGVELADEAFFRDRSLSMHYYRIGSDESDTTADNMLGYGYEQTPDGYYAFAGSRYNWRSYYKVYVDTGITNPDPATPAGFVNNKTFRVMVAFRLADITPEIVVGPGGASELILNLRTRNSHGQKTFSASSRLPKSYSVSILEENTQVLDARSFGSAIAYMKKDFNFLNLFGEPKKTLIEDIVEVDKIDLSNFM